MAGSVEAAVKKRIAQLPEELWTSVDALIALNLARQLDNQVGGASAAKELRLIMAGLVIEDEKKPQGDDLDDLVARRAARRAAAQAG